MFKHISVLAALMTLVVGAAVPLAASAQTASSLAGTSWVLTQYAVQRSAFMPAVGDRHPTLMFSNDGYMSGNTGCNSYGGPYTQSGDQINVGTVITTLRACLDQGVMDQEHLMLTVLNGNVAVTLKESQLTLSGPAGALMFEAASDQANGPTTPGMPQTGEPTGWPLLPAVLIPVLLVTLGLVVRQAVAKMADA